MVNISTKAFNFFPPALHCAIRNLIVEKSSTLKSEANVKKTTLAQSHLKRSLMMISAYSRLLPHIHGKSLFHYKLSISLNELCCVAAVHAVVVVVKIIVFVSNFDYETFDAFCLPHHHCSLLIQSNVSNRFDVIATINTHEELYVEKGERVYTQ